MNVCIAGLNVSKTQVEIGPCPGFKLMLRYARWTRIGDGKENDDIPLIALPP
jgi:hypothetical protein